MYLTKLRMKNFMPFKGDQLMTFPEDMNRNVVLVFGDNMRGKTSLMNALRWVFYGKAVDRYLVEIPLDRLINVDAAGEGDWELAVEAAFTHDQKKYKISRIAKRGRGVGTPKRPEDFLVETTLVQDGEVMRGDQVAHVINQIVPEQISRFFLFDGELLQEYESLLADEDEQGRKIKEAIEKVLGVPALIQGKDDLRIMKKPFEKQMALDLRKYANIKHFTDKLTELDRNGDKLESDKAELSNGLEKAKSSYQELQKQVDAAENKYIQRSSLDQKLEARKGFAEEIKILENRKLEVIKDSWRDLLRPGLDKRMASLQIEIAADNDVLLAESNRSYKRELIEKSIEDGVCSLCLNTLGEAETRLHRHLNEEKINTDFELISSRLAGHNRLAKRLSEIRYPQAKNILAEISTKAYRVAADETKITNEIDRLKGELENYDSDQMMRTRKAAENASHAVRQLESRLADVLRSLEANSSDQSKMRLLINENKDARDQRSSRIVSLTSDLEKIFSSAIEKLRDDLRCDIEKKATTAFKSLTTDSSYKGLRINNNYGLTIIDESGRDVTLRSAGAEQIVALSLIDGLNQTGRSAGPVIMDTPFGRLDPNHRSRVLRHLPNSALQVILFVHEGEVNKENDLSEINPRIGAMFSLERVSSSQTNLVRL